MNAASFGFPTLASTDVGKVLQINSTYNGYNAVESFSRRNIIVNGDFSVWQRGTSFTGMTDGFCASYWKYITNGSQVVNITLDTDVPTVAQAGRKFKNSVKIIATTGNASPSAGNYALFRQHIEGYDYEPLAQKTKTHSFWIKSTKTGTLCLAFNNSAQDRSFIKEVTINAANTWELKTINIAAEDGTGTWDYTTGTGLYVDWALLTGTDFNGTKDAWTTQTAKFATTGKTNFLSATNDSIKICAVQLEKGDIATPFEFIKYSDQFHKCMRILRAYGGYGSYDVAGQGSGKSTTTADVEIQLDPPMRIAPVLTYSGNWQCSQRSAADAVTSMSLVSASTSDKTATIQVTTASGLAQYRPYRLEAANSNASRLYLSSEF